MLTSGAYNAVYTKGFVFCVTFPRVSFALHRKGSAVVTLISDKPNFVVAVWGCQREISS